MSHEPPIPEAARSPYPLHPEPIAHDETPAPENSTVQQQAASSEAARPANETWADQARETFDRVKDSKVALGAAVGIGSAALLAALLFARRGKSNESRPVAREAVRRRRKTTSDA
jgi:hypothetical protein